MSKYIIGTLCKRKHKYQGQLQSLRRYKANGKPGGCLICEYEKGRRWRLENPEKVAQQSKKWRTENKEKALEACKDWRESNRQKAVDSSTNWRKNNLDRHCQNQKEREARKRAALYIPFTSEEWQKKCNDFKNLCAYCDKETQNITEDHIIPLSSAYKEHSLRNLVPSCRNCNSAKKDKNVLEWVKKAPPWLEELKTEEWFLIAYHQAFMLK